MKTFLIPNDSISLPRGWHREYPNTGLCHFVDSTGKIRATHNVNGILKISGRIPEVWRIPAKYLWIRK